MRATLKTHFHCLVSFYDLWFKMSMKKNIRKTSSGPTTYLVLSTSANKFPRENPVLSCCCLSLQIPCVVHTCLHLAIYICIILGSINEIKLHCFKFVGWMWDVLMHLHLCMHQLLPCRKRFCSGLCGAVAGLFGAGGGVGAGLLWRGQTQGVLTRRGATAAAAGCWGSSRRGGWRRRVAGHSPATILQPVRCQLNFVW